MPLFAKSHSYGEYVFDWAWADAHERHGVELLPEAAVRGALHAGARPRLLAAGERERRALAARRSSSRSDAPRCTCCSPPRTRPALLQEQGMLLRRTVQFHWRNEGYADFEAFLAPPDARAAQEHPPGAPPGARGGRQPALARGRGDRAREHWEFFNRCYRAHLRRAPLEPLPQPGFLPAHRRRAAAATSRMVLAERDGRPIAARCSCRTASALYGRYWGALEHVPLLHFECCYYQAIEYAIAPRPAGVRGRRAGRAQDLPRPDAGRGALGALAGASAASRARWRTSSQREGAGIARYVDELCEHSPFKKAQEEK